MYKYSKTQSPNLPKLMILDPYLNLDPHLIFVSSQKTVIEALEILVCGCFIFPSPILF